MKYNLDNLPLINKKGLALDIDETLAWTIGFWVEELQKTFGNPENLSVHEVIEKYRYTQNVPYWQSKEALDWMDIHRNDNDIQKRLPLIKDSYDAVLKIDKIVPICAYITTRPILVIEGTRIWLKKNGFPKAPIICRPNSLPTEEGNDWKARVLEKLYPKVQGIVDDNIGLVNAISEKYSGYIFLYSHKECDSIKNIIPCLDWQNVYDKVKNVFKTSKYLKK